MIDRKLNIIMVVFGALGGVAGHFAGRALFVLNWPHPVLAALYMAALGLGIVLFCVLAETLFPIINGMNWKRNYAGVTWRYLVPAAVLPLLLAGGIMQLIYQTDFQPKTGRDVYILIDRSGSMEWNDPANERLAAVRRLVENFDKRDRVEIITFDSTAEVIQGLTPVNTDAYLNELTEKLSVITPREGTDFNLALSLTYGRIADNRQADSTAKKQETMVIMLSDGESELDDAELTPFLNEGIQVNTVGLLLDVKDGEAVLAYIARRTGGLFVFTDNTDQLDQAFTAIYQTEDRFILNTKDKTEVDILQWLLFVIAGLLIGLVTAFIFDNRYIIWPLSIGGAIGGLLAGGVLCWPVDLLLPAVILGCVFTWFTLFSKTPPVTSFTNTSGTTDGNGFLQNDKDKTHGRF